MILLLALVGCDADPTAHPGHGAPDNVISGTVVANGVETPAVTILFATSADNPMPPVGTGRPATLSTVPAHAFTGDGAGLQAASYTISGVPDGDWLLTGFMDLDRDFHPTVDAMGGATCGDIGGAHLANLASPELAAVSVRGGELLDDVTVTLGSQFPLERPAFHPVVEGEPGVPAVSMAEALAAAQAGGLVTYGLRSTAVHAAFKDASGDVTLTYDLEGPYAPTEPPGWDAFLGTPVCETAFYAWVKGAGMDGPDVHPELGAPFLDIWPRLGLSFLGERVDTDGDAVPDAFSTGLPPGERWAAPGVVSPGMVLTGQLPVGFPVLTDHLDVAFLPVAQHTFPAAEADCAGTWTDGSCTELVTDPAAIPRGAWSITVISETGQTWTVPNALAASESVDEAFLPGAQLTWLELSD